MKDSVTWSTSGAWLLTVERNASGARVERSSFLGHVATKEAMYRFSQERGLAFFDLTQPVPRAVAKNFAERPAFQPA